MIKKQYETTRTCSTDDCGFRVTHMEVTEEVKEAGKQ